VKLWGVHGHPFPYAHGNELVEMQRGEVENSRRLRDSLPPVGDSGGVEVIGRSRVVDVADLRRHEHGRKANV
jgi:hypothetical protein